MQLSSFEQISTKQIVTEQVVRRRSQAKSSAFINRLRGVRGVLVDLQFVLLYLLVVQFQNLLIPFGGRGVPEPLPTG